MMGNGLAAYTQGESRVHIHNISLDIVMGFVVERDVNRLKQLTCVSIIFALLKVFFFLPKPRLIVLSEFSSAQIH